MNTLYLIDLFILLAAVYMLYIAVTMKRTMKIHKSIMADEMRSKCLDEKGFINYIYPYVLIFGIVSLLAGIAGFLFDYLQMKAYLTYISTGAFLLVFIIFVYFYKKAMSKYFTS